LGYAIGRVVLSRETSGEKFTKCVKEINTALREWADSFPPMVTDLGDLTQEEKDFIAGLRRQIPLDTKDISDLAIEMLGSNSSASDELSNTQQKQEQFPEVKQYWEGLNERINSEIAGSRTVVDQQLKTATKDVLRLIAGDNSITDVDEFTSTVTGKNEARLEKSDYRYVQGKLDIVKDMQSQDYTVNVIMPNSVEKIERYENKEVENQLIPVIALIRHEYGLSDKEIASVCLKLIYQDQAYPSDTSEDTLQDPSSEADVKE